MTEAEIIVSLKNLVDAGVSRSKVEKDLGMPINQLSGVMNGKKVFPAKWKSKLELYIKLQKDAQNNFAQQLEKTLNASNSEQSIRESVLDIAEQGIAITHTTSEKTIRIDPQDEKAIILKQIAAIQAEKIPELRNRSALGQKSWKLEQQKRIKELENLLK